jgi:predicted transposase YdaD
MSRTGKDPHNALFLKTFGELEHARSYLATLLPAAVLAHLDLSTLKTSAEHFVDEKLRELESDLLFTVEFAGRECLVYLLLEHQSTVDPLMPFRLLRYMVRIWDQWLRDNPKATGLPVIIPLVLCHAPSGWTAVRGFAELLNAPDELLMELRPLLPNFRPLIDDLADRPDQDLEELKATALVRLVLLLFKHIRDRDLPEKLPRLSKLFRAVASSVNGREALILILMYILESHERVTPEGLRWLGNELDDPEQEVLMTAGERLRQEGWEQGLEKGRQEGLEKGLDKGRREGQRRVLLKQLRLRFGQIPRKITARVAKAEAEQLELWAERILTASSIDEVLQ